MQNNLMLEQIRSIPDLIRRYIPQLEQMLRTAFTADFTRSLDRIYLCGCGDSHHAALASQMSFEVLAGIPTQALTSMQFARYCALNLPQESALSSLVIGISVSGEVVRTIEALLLGSAAGASTWALTGSPTNRLAGAAQNTLVIPSPDPQPESDLPIPGTATFIINQLALFLAAIRIAESRGTLTTSQASAHREQVGLMADAAAQTIRDGCDAARAMAFSWEDENEFVFTGAGPNLGSALYSAAKLPEASGDSAVGQDLEEWAHLQYFARNPSTPTFVISAGGRDMSRAVEIIQAARGIKRQVAAITTQQVVELAGGADFFLPIPDGLPEIFSSLVTCLPGALFAAHRAQILDEPYFRAFGGGRNPEGGGGMSRIQTSRMLEDPQFLTDP